MYLSDRDLMLAVKSGLLIIRPEPTDYDTTSIDLHLDSVDQARVWDAEAFARQQQDAGHEAYLGIGSFNHDAFAKQFHRPLPDDENLPVYRRNNEVIIQPRGFLLWQTKEEVGTPEADPRLICFMDGKSTKARTGLVVHMTAPTIHAGWWGKVTLEIANLGPFKLCLRPGDAIVQIVVALVTSPPTKKKQAKGVAIGQSDVAGHAA